MSLNKEQRKHMASIRKLIKSRDWSDVRQGIALLKSINEPYIWAIMGEGVQISQAGWLELGPGEITKRVRKEYQRPLTYWAAHYTGKFRPCRYLDLCMLSYGGARNVAVEDLSPLAGLEHLTHLQLNGFRSTDLSPLSGLTGLTRLTLRGFRSLRDLTPLQGLVNLSYLHVTGCPIEDLSPLSGLTSLRMLSLSHCAAVTDLRPLKGLRGLESLYLLKTGVSEGEKNVLRYWLPDCSIS